MNVLHIIDTLSIGGAERLLVGTINAMQAADHHVIILADKAPLASELPADCRLMALGFRGKKDIFFATKQIRKYIRSNSISIVHSHLVMSNILARMATPRRVPLINSIHNINGPRLYRGLFSPVRWLEKLTYKRRHMLIAVSQVVLEDYKKYIGIKGKSEVLYNFVEDRFFSPVPRYYTKNCRELKLVAVGSFKPQKNYAFLIKAFNRLPPGVTLDIYGDGPLRKEMEAQAASLKGVIRFRGNCASIDDILPLYDLFVMSSFYEGHPIALMEAAAAGLPALVSDIPVLHEALGEKGLYFDIERPESFQETILEILDGKIDLNSLAVYNWQLAANMARQSVYIEKLFTLYQELIGAKKALSGTIKKVPGG